jgi:hypothetical protein
MWFVGIVTVFGGEAGSRWDEEEWDEVWEEVVDSTTSSPLKGREIFSAARWRPWRKEW